MSPTNPLRPARAGRRLRRWAARLCAALVTLAVMLLVRAQTAAAAPAVVLAADKVGQTPAALSWIQLQDSRGISIWNFEMSLDRGGITNPDKFFWSSITDTCWGIYRGWCALALWFLDWVMSFSWVSTIAAPLRAVGKAMTSVAATIGAVPTLLTITACVAAVWMMRGKWATGLWELGMALVIASLASGVFAQPVELVAGPNGYVVKANQTGLQLAAELATGDAAGKTPEQLRKAQTGQLVDTFIRQPTQMINFGRVLDGSKCENAYNDVVRKGPYGNDDDIRDKIGDCDDALGDYAGNPTASMALGSIVFMPAAFVVLLMSIVLAGSVVAAGCWAMFQSLKAIVTLITGLLPGGGRGSLLLTVAETLVSLLIIVFTSVFLAVFLLVIQELFKGDTGAELPKTFVLADVMILVGVVVYWRQRKLIRQSSQRLAQWMAQRPGGGQATRLPDRHPGLNLGGAATAVGAMAGLARMSSQRRPGGPTFIDARQQAVGFALGGHTAPESRSPIRVNAQVVPDRQPAPGRPQLPGRGNPPALPPGGGPPQLPPGPGGPGPSGSGARARLEASRRSAITSRLARAGTNAALAYVTGGASTAITATKAARSVNTVRRAALTTRLAAAQTPPPPPSRTSPGAGRVIVGEVVASQSSRPTRTGTGGR